MSPSVIELPLESIKAIWISPGHDFVGHHGRKRDSHDVKSCASAEIIAGRGIRGDRYANRELGHPRQVTFLAAEVIAELMAEFPNHHLRPQDLRRNILTEGVNLPALIGTQFRIGEMLFQGVEESRPCYWMDEVIAPGAAAFLKGKGGLRAQALNSGHLRAFPNASLLATNTSPN